MTHIVLFGTIAAAIIALKYLLQAIGYLDVMPGPRWIEHSHLIVLIVIPAPDSPLRWLVYALWAFGYWAMLDDVYQERRRQKGKEVAVYDGLLIDDTITGRPHPGILPMDMYYRSPLHRWAERMGVI